MSAPVKNEMPDNLAIYDSNWDTWLDMKRHGPASRWLRSLIGDSLSALQSAPASIHDVGCGLGINTTHLAERFPAALVRGSDFSSTAIEVATRTNFLGNVEYKHDPSGSEIDSSAEMVTCFEVLEHVEDWKPFLFRLAKGAERYLLLSFPTGRMRPFEVNVGHIRNFQHGEVEAELNALGFESLHLSYAGFPFYSPIYRDICQATNAGESEFTKGDYGFMKRTLSSLIYTSFRHFSTQRNHGDQFVGLFSRVQQTN